MGLLHIPVAVLAGENREESICRSRAVFPCVRYQRGAVQFC